MPQAVAALIVTAIGLTGTAATIATAVVSLAISVGLNFAAQALFGKKTPPAQRPSDVQQLVTQSISSRVRHFGTVHRSGALTFKESKNGTLYSLITTAHGATSNRLEIRLNNEPVTVNSSGLVTDASYRNAVRIFTRDGDKDQGHYTALSSVFSDWTSDHRQRGCSSALLISGPVSSEVFSDVYPGNTEPTYTEVVESEPMYDPRESSHVYSDPDTWTYSDNAAIVIGNYLASEDGYGLGEDTVDWDIIASEADICDETLTSVDGRTVKKWRLCGSYQMSEDQRRTVLAEMLKACDAFIWQQADGTVAIRVGKWVEPRLHITDRHIVSVTATLGGDPQETTDEVRAIYSDPRLDFNETESAGYSITDTPSQDNSQRLDVFYCPDHNQAVRLAKRYALKLSERWSLTLTTNLYGLNAIGERFILVSVEDLEIDSVPFEITSMNIDPQANLVEIGLTETSESDFTFDSVTEEGTPPPIPADTTSVDTVVLPQNVVLSGEEAGGGVILVADWDQATGRPDYTYEAQFKETTNSSWLPMAVSNDERRAVAGPLSVGRTYSVRVRSLTLFGRPSGWTAVENITLSAAPSQPTSFSLSESSGDVVVSWRNPQETIFSHTEIYRSSTDDFSSSSQIGSDMEGALGETMTYTDSSPGTGTWYYWILSVSTSDTSSSAVGSESITLT